jgi:hypothetical protein
VKAGKSKLTFMEDVMKNRTIVAIGAVALIISGQSLAAAGRPFGLLGLEPQSAQQQAMERLREVQARQQEMERQREQQQARQQEMERQREQQQARQQEMERQREQQQARQQEMERQREQQQARQQEMERQRAQGHPEPENRSQYVPHNVAPENRPYSNVQPERRLNLGANHPNTTVLKPTVITPAMRHAMTYNNRPGGVHINPAYFATHYGPSHGFHFANYAGGACIGDCGLRLFGGEWYFNWNGGWFGLMGPMPGNWGFQTDYLYIDIGDDGNYYLYDAQFPDMAVQLTFVQNLGDDQAGADQDQGDQSGQ